MQAKEEMKAARSVYEGINSDLKEELPALYDRSGIGDFFFSPFIYLFIFVNFRFKCFSSFSRIGCYVGVFSALSNLRDIFYKEMSTVCLALSRHTVFIVM